MALNIYEFLGYKDTKASDSEVLDALKKEKQKWTNKMMQQPDRAKAKLDSIKELEAEIAANPSMLAEHKKMFGDIQKEKRKEQEKFLRDEASIFVINGEIEETHLNALQKKNPSFTADEILFILGAKIKQKRRPKTVLNEKGKIIDRTIYKGITDELAKLEKKDLYDFLGLKPTAKIADIKTKNDEIYKDLTSGSLTRPGYNSIKNLTGIVQVWLYDENKRADYDRTLNSESFQSVANKIDQISSTGKIIQPEQYKMLVEECTKKGMSLDRAEALIFDYAETKDITIVDGGLSGNTITCRFCGSINDKNSSICKECGMPLVIPCPSCGKQSSSSDEMRCTKCGFNIGEMPLALRCLNDAGTRLGFKNVDGAMQSLMEAERYWPGYKGLAQMKTKILSTPPAPPTSLNVSVSGNSVSIEWNAAETKYIQYEYIVVRKADSAPNSHNDGKVVATTRDKKISDVISNAGVNFYYAVYTKNGNQISAQGAKSQNSVMVVTDIKGSDITLDVQETQIGFNFKKTFAKCIEIYRDGQKIASITGNTFIDNNLSTGKAYSYKFVAIYVDNNGKQHQSAGLTQTITPIAPPKPVDLKLESDEKVATISWNKPAVGTLVLFQSDKPFPVLPGNKVSLDSMRYEQVETIGTSVRIAKNWSGIRYYLPVTTQSGIGVAGKSVSIVSIDTVPGVTVGLDGKKVTIKWKWDNCTAVRVSYVFDGNIKKDSDIERATSPQPEFFVMTPEGCKSVSVSVMALVKTPEQTLLSAPVTKTLSLKPAKVQFESVVNVKKMLFMSSNEYEVSLTTDSVLPCDLHVLASEHTPPMNLVNYNPLAVIKPNQVSVGNVNTFKVTYERRSKSAPLYFRLIVADRSLSKIVVINSEIKQL